MRSSAHEKLTSPFLLQAARGLKISFGVIAAARVLDVSQAGARKRALLHAEASAAAASSEWTAAEGPAAWAPPPLSVGRASDVLLVPSVLEAISRPTLSWHEQFVLYSSSYD